MDSAAAFARDLGLVDFPIGDARKETLALSETLLDVKGLRCPLPVLRARKAMKPLASGDIIEVHATDPSAVQDFENFCRTTGDELLESRDSEGVYIFRIRKA